jgi:hypothetical protein
MFNSYDNQSIRKLVIAFGSLFDEIYVSRKNDTTGITENIKVPITFSSKEKFLRRLESNSSISDDVKTQINIPYLSFEIANIAYDFGRKRNKLTTTSEIITASDGSISESYKTFSETPISVIFNLYFYSRSLNELFQVLEQVLPYFNPEFNMRMNFNKIFKNVNVPIAYRDFKIIDDYEGSLQSRRTMIGVMSFNASSYVFGEIKPTVVIEDVIDDTVIDIDIDVDIDDPPIPMTEILINSTFGNSTYFLPFGQSGFASSLTWTETGVFDLNTTVSIFTNTNSLLYTQIIPAGTLSLTNTQITNMISGICTQLNICGMDDGSLRKLVLRIQNGTTVAQKDFRVIMDCTTACQ